MSFIMTVNETHLMSTWAALNLAVNVIPMSTRLSQIHLHTVLTDLHKPVGV